MMQPEQSIRFEPLRVSDASLVKKAGLLLPTDRSTSLFRDEIRQLLKDCRHQSWLAYGSADADLPLAITGYSLSDLQDRRAAMHVAVSDSISLEAVILALVDKLFWEHNLYRVEMLVPQDQQHYLEVLNRLGFKREGSLRNGFLDQSSGRHLDLIALALLRPEQSLAGVAFVPFRLGLFAIAGRNNGLFASRFLRHGETADQSFFFECAELAGLLDDSGKIKFDMKSKDYTALDSTPQIVLEAASQVSAYFAGKREVFDLPVSIEIGSDFQKSVWKTLDRIPYGTTWTYEDLAFQLTQPDQSAAKRLSRAVGSACAANPLPLILPCHRVIGKGGKLVGFSGGLDIKEYLLDHEIMGY